MVSDLCKIGQDNGKTPLCGVFKGDPRWCRSGLIRLNLVKQGGLLGQLRVHSVMLERSRPL